MAFPTQEIICRTQANPRKFWSPTWPEINLVLGLAQFLHIIACVKEAKNMPLLEHLLHIVNLSSYLVFLCSDVSLCSFLILPRKKFPEKRNFLYKCNNRLGQLSRFFYFSFLVKNLLCMVNESSFHQLSWPKVSISKSSDISNVTTCVQVKQRKETSGKVLLNAYFNTRATPSC